MPCLCGDSQCPSCGVAQGTLDYPTEAEMDRAYAAEPKCERCGGPTSGDPLCPDCQTRQRMEQEPFDE